MSIGIILDSAHYVDENHFYTSATFMALKGFL